MIETQTKLKEKGQETSRYNLNIKDQKERKITSLNYDI